MDNNRIERFFVISPMRMEAIDRYFGRNSRLCLDLFFHRTRQEKPFYMGDSDSFIRENDQVLLHDQTM